MVEGEGACLLAALSLHGLLPQEFPREAWNLAVGAWFRLGGTQKANVSHCLYSFQAGQCSQPLSQPAAGSPQCLVGFTCDGREVNAAITDTHVCLSEAPTTTVWVAILSDACLPFMELRKTLAVECTGLGVQLHGTY